MKLVLSRSASGASVEVREVEEDKRDAAAAVVDEVWARLTQAVTEALPSRVPDLVFVFDAHGEEVVALAEEAPPGVYALHAVRPPSAAAPADPVEAAAAAFAHALRAQPGATALDAAAATALGRRAAQVVAAGLEWYEHVGEIVDVHRAQAVLHVGSRQAVYDLVKRNRLLGLRRSGGAMAIPLFQIDPATGRPYRIVPAVLAAFADAEVDAYTVASWFNTPQDELDGDTPAMAIRDAGRDEAVRTCALRAADRWSQ